MSSSEHFDVVVVGSGFGGSVMALRLARAGLRVCVLERGKRYPPGSFPRSPRDLQSSFWNPGLGQLGLFQVWDFGNIAGLVSAGLGGGSLIYANVLLRKDARWFVRRRPDGGVEEWPVRRQDLDPHYDRVAVMLRPQPYPFHLPPYSETPKTRAFRHAAQRAGLDWSLPDLAVSFADGDNPPAPGEPIHDAGGGTTGNLHGRTRSTCRLCGECDLGCNYGSKNTLDFTYLTEADQLGVSLRDRCEVRAFGPRAQGGYWVRYVEHRPEHDGRGGDVEARPSVELVADRLVLAAGTFGTTHLLLRNRAQLPDLSDRLGRSFSGNGDFLGFLHDAHEDVDGDRRPMALDPSRGCVITSTVRLPDGRDAGGAEPGLHDEPGLYVQDGGYPGFVDWLVEASEVGPEMGRLARFIGQRLVSHLSHRHRTDLGSQVRAMLGDAHRSAGILPLLGMGLDTPDGTMSLDGDGALALRWSSASSRRYFDRVVRTMERIAEQLDAHLRVDPLWRLHHTVVTVHPLGGCSMGRTPDDGVTDSYGRVFGYPGLVVADGSVMPGPVGPNPSFTIAALADRFADQMVRDAGCGSPS